MKLNDQQQATEDNNDVDAVAGTNYKFYEIYNF